MYAALFWTSLDKVTKYTAVCEWFLSKSRTSESKMQKNSETHNIDGLMLIESPNKMCASLFYVIY